MFGMTANLSYGPPVNTDINYNQYVFRLIFVSGAMLVVRYLVEEKLVHVQ